MATAQHVVARELPELATVTALGVGQLDADALLVIDERRDRDDIVACTGPTAADLVSELGDLPRLRHRAVAEDVVLTPTRRGVVVSVPVAHDAAPPLGTMHTLHRRSPPGPDCATSTFAQRALAVARQIGLVIARRDATPTPAAAPVRAWLSDLDVLPSSPQALARMTGIVTGGLRSALGATAACITVWDEERSVLRALPGAFGSADKALGASITGPPTNAHSLASRVFVTGRPYMTNHASGDPGLLQQYVDVFALRRVLAAPLTIGTHRIGVIILVNKPDPFTIADVTELETVAPQISVAVKLALTTDKIRRSQRMERILATTATEIAAGAPLAQCFARALEDLGTVTDSSLAALSPSAMAPVVWRGGDVEPSLQARFEHEAGEMARCAVGAFPHAAGDPGWAAIHAPVMFSGYPVAAVSLLRQTGMPFGADETETLTRLASLAALAWASERYRNQIAELALSRERARIADELHDRVAQILFAAQIGIDSLLESGATDEDGRLIDIRGLLTRGEAAIRDVIEDCAARPQTELGARLESVTQALGEEFNVLVHTDLPAGATFAGLARSVADCIVRVAHEAIVNSAKHAGPCRITLGLAVGETGSLRLDVCDDGVGRPEQQPFAARHGLDSMRRSVDEAGGRLAIASGPDGRGTLVTATFSPAAA